VRRKPFPTRLPAYKQALWVPKETSGPSQRLDINNDMRTVASNVVWCETNSACLPSKGRNKGMIQAWTLARRSGTVVTYDVGVTGRIRVCHHVVLCHIMYTKSHVTHIMSYHVTSCHVMSSLMSFTSCHIMSCQVSCHSHHVMRSSPTTSKAAPQSPARHIMSCHDVS
jgi:hypothetical protein